MTILDPDPSATLRARSEVQEAARRIRQALTRLGYAHEGQDGHLWEVSFRALYLDTSRSYGLIEVDTERLPRRVSIARLTHRDVLHHLTAVVGKPVRLLNTSGLTYCVVLKPRPKARLPRKVELDLDTRPQGQYMIPIGQGRDGPAWRSLSSTGLRAGLATGHILVGGESGSGKSVWVNACLAALLAAHSPQELRLALIDPKGVEFTAWRGIEHLALEVATDVAGACAVTGWLVGEMERRSPLFAGLFARNLASYNERAEEPLPLVVAVVDEVTDIALQAGLKSDFYTDLIRLASKARSFGIVLILATQNPKAEVLNTLIRGNLSTRIAFRTATPEHSRTILGVGGAEAIPRTVPGRMKARLDEGLVDLQGYHVDDERILALAARRGGARRPALSELERRLVAHAVAELDGAFTIGSLYEAFKGEISKRQLEKLGREWERRGWLSEPESVTEPRRVTEALLAASSTDPSPLSGLRLRTGAGEARETDER